MKNKISVLLVDDHPVFRKGLRAMLEEEGITVAGEAGDGGEAVAKARELAPDVIVMDISMPGVDGIEATRRIVAELPDTKVLPLSIHSGKRFVENMLRAGAAGYVLKESAPEDLVEAIRKVCGGDVFLSAAVSGVVLSEYMRLLNQPAGGGVDGGLSDEEEVILRLTREGYAVKEIAVALDKSAGAVQSARRRLVKKLGLGSVGELAAYAAADRWSEGGSRVEVPTGSGENPVGGLPILATKFYPPGLPPGYVHRKRLVDGLEAGKNAALTVVSAPAGYGKSALLAEWISLTKRPAAWLSLDDGDSDPSVFLTYLAAAVGAVFPEGCPNTRALLQAPRLPSHRIVAGYLLNDLSALGASFELVLDDYHQIHSTAIHEILSEVFRHPPGNVHWYILTRHDPPLPLAGLRAGGQLAEIRFGDLRATAEEAAAVMRGAPDVRLEDHEFKRFYDASEGWITALRLMALAFVHRGGPAGMIEELDSLPLGIQEYLAEQVLTAQTPEFQEMVLKTAVLDRFCPPLCEALWRGDGASEPDGVGFIARLVEEGLFMIPMDASGTWYRFHHLFQHFLQQRLANTAGEGEVAALHLRASCWLEENGLIDEALAHASKAGDSTRLAGILESHLHGQLNADRWMVLERWLTRIPEELKQQRPKLLLAEAFVATERYRLDKIPALIQRIETLIDDRSAEPEVLGALNLFRGQMQFWQGKAGRGLELFLEARGQIPAPHHLVAGEIELHIGLALQALGRHEEARKGLKAGMRDSSASAPVFLSRLLASQAFVDQLSGDLGPAAEGARRLESLGAKHGIAYTEIWGTYLRALAQFHWMDLDAAMRGFSILAEKIYFMHSRAAADSLAGLALTCQAGSHPDEAIKAAQKLREFAEESGEPQLLDLAGSCDARLAVWRGDLEPALRWQRSFQEPLDIPSMLFWLGLPAITECRVLIARGTEADLRQAAKKLTVLRSGLGELHNTCHLIDVMVLQALALEKQGQSDAALKTLGAVVEMAEPGGWIRPFVEAGPLIADMLARLEASEQTAEFVRQLRASFHEVETDSPDKAAAARAPEQPLIEPLTNRELDVLELLAERLYDKEIANRLSISPQTVRSHLKHIFGKMGVGDRRQAVTMGRQLGLLRGQ